MSTLSPNLAIPTPAPTDAVSRANYNAAITAIDTNAPRCFNPRAAVYGAKFDGQFISDGAMSSVANQTVLTSASGVANPVPWAPADVGKTVWVFGATTQADGHTLSALQAQILSYQGPGQVTLSLPATVTVSGAFVAWGTDDSTALQHCMDDAHAASLARGGGASYVFLWGTTLYASQLYQRDGVHLLGSAKRISMLLDAGSYTSFGIKPNETSGVRASNVGLHKLTIQGSTGPCIPFHGNLSLSGDGIVVDDVESAGGSESGIDFRSGARPVIRAEIHGQKVGKTWNGSGFTNAKAIGLRVLGGDLGIQQPQITVQIHDTDSAGLVIEGGHPGVPPNGTTTAPITGGSITASLQRVLQFIADADGEIDWAYGAALSQPQGSVVKITVDGCQNASDVTRHSGRYVFGFLLDQGLNLCKGNSFEFAVTNAPHIDILNGACLQGNRGTLQVDTVGVSNTLIFFRDGVTSLIDPTTLTQTVTANASAQAVTVASVSALKVGQHVVIGVGTANVEVVTITAVGTNTISAIFAQSHASGEVVQPGPSFSVAITANASPQTVAVTSMLHMDVGRAVVVDNGSVRELVTLTAVAPSGGITDPGTVTAIFTQNHVLGTEIKGGAAALDNTFAPEVADQTTAYALAMSLLAFTAGLGAKRNRLLWPRLGNPVSTIGQATTAPATNADIPVTGPDANHIVGVTYTAAAVDGAGLYFGKTRSSRLTIEGTGIVGLMGDSGAQHAQEFHVYDQWNDASNYRRLTFKSSTTDFRVVGEAIGSFAGSAFNIHIGTETATSLTFRTNATSRWSVNGSGHLLASTDNAVDIGAAGATRPRNGFFAGAVATGVKAGAAVDGDVTNPTDGMLRLDSTNGRIYARYGGAWHFVALT